MSRNQNSSKFECPTGILKLAEPPGAQALGNFMGPGPAAMVSADNPNAVRKVSPSSQQTGKRNQAQELLGDTAGGYLEQQAGFGTPASVSNMTQLDDLMGGGKTVIGSDFQGVSLKKLSAEALRETPLGSDVDFRSMGMLLGLAESRKQAEVEEATRPGKKLISGARSTAASARELLTGLHATVKDTVRALAQPTGRTIYTSRRDR